MGVVRAIIWTLAVAAWPWALAALLLWPHAAPVVRGIAACALVAVTAAAVRRAPPRWRGATVLAAALPVAASWSFVRPQADRAWAAGHERTPAAVLSGDFVTIDNVRNADWRGIHDVDMRWETRRYDLRTLRTVDLVVEPFRDWRGPAHLFVTFGFEDGEHVAISVESRREAGETYAPLRGAFRHYELLYVVGDERDLLGLRANIRRDDVYVFPTRASPDEARALFTAMLTRGQSLAGRPGFYNTLTTTCATSLLRHVNALRTEKVSLFDWRILFPGFADELAWDLGLIDSDGTLEEARARWLINDRAAFDPALDGPAWSRKIRAGR